MILHLLLLATVSAWLPGQVMLPDGSPAAGATVELLDTDGGQLANVAADHDGNFRLPLAGSPPWRIVAEFGSYTPAVLVIDHTPEDRLRLTLGPPAFSALTEVLAPAPQTPRHRVPATTLIASGAVLDALETTTAAARIGAGGAGDTPAVRGVARRRVATHLDGARLPGFRRVGTSLEAIDPLLLENVAVEPGSRSALTGSDAIGGTVEVRTLSPAVGTRVMLHAVSASRQWGLMAAQPLITGQRELLLGVAVRSAGDQRTPLGTMQPSSYDRGNLLLSASGLTADGTWAGRLLLAALDDVGRPRWQRQDRPTVVPAAFLGRLGFTWWGLGPSWLGADTVELGITVGRRREATERWRDGAVSQRSDIAAFDLDARALIHTRRGHHRLAGGINLGATINQQARVSDAAGVGWPMADGDMVGLGLVASDLWSVAADWEVELGLRADLIADRAVTPTGTAKGDFAALTGCAQVSHMVTEKTSVWFAASRAFRAPTLDERYYTGPTGRGTVSGNPDLDPETGLSYEGGVTLRTANWAGNVTLFRTVLSSPIERIEVAEDIFSYVNRINAHLYGVELALSTIGTGPWSSRAALGYIRSTSDDRTALADVAPARLTLSTEYIRPHWRLGGRVLAAARKDRPGPSEVERASWARCDLWASSRVGADFNLRLELRNLLDAEIWPSADRLAIPAEGRSLAVTVIWEPGSP